MGESLQIYHQMSSQHECLFFYSMNHIISSSVPATLHALVQLQNQPLHTALPRKAKKSHSVFPLVFITSCLVFYSIVLGPLLTWHFICTFYSKQGRRRKTCLQPSAFKRLVSQNSSCILFLKLVAKQFCYIAKINKISS